MSIDAAQADETAWLAEVLTRRIPLGGAMQLSIARLDDEGIELHAPLAPNINDKGTGFGGALVAQMILAGWALPRLLLRRAGVPADLVIGRCEVRFLSPVTTEFSVRCAWPEPALRAKFVEQVRCRGRGKLELAPECMADDAVAATLSARYAALGRGDDTAEPDE